MTKFYIRDCLWDNWKPSFLPLLIFNWCTFLRRVTDAGDVSEQKIKCWPMRTQEIGGIRLSDGLYDNNSHHITLDVQ